MNKFNKQIINWNCITCYIFTTDSKYLFAPDIEGRVYGYFVSKGFKTFYN